MEEDFLGARYEELLAEVERLAGKPPEKVKPEEVARLRRLLEARKGDVEKGLRAAAEINRRLAKAFRTKHPAWFEKGDEPAEEPGEGPEDGPGGDGGDGAEG